MTTDVLCLDKKNYEHMILLNDILQLKDTKHVKLRFNLYFSTSNGTNRPAIDYFTDCTESSRTTMLNGHYWNCNKRRNYKVGNITLGFVKIPYMIDCWLLFHVGRVTKDLDVRNGVGYEYEIMNEYDKYIGRIVIRFKNHSQNLIRRGDSTLKDCKLEEILPEVYNNDFFPGYSNINVSWKSLEILIHKESWRTALCNQKGVYLLIDQHTGKQYVGSAYGQDMLLGRWEYYIKTHHGGNKKMKGLGNKYIEDNFYFSILDTYNQNTDNQIIIERERHWIDVLRTKDFGYNDN